MFAYYRLALSEEKVVTEKFGDEYLIYKLQVPAFVHSFKKVMIVFK